MLDHGDSDPELVARLRLVADELGMGLERWDGPGGRAAAENVGLQVALDAEADAVLIDPDVEFSLGPWLPALLARAGEPGRPAGVVGGRLLTPHGTLHGAGFFFSRLSAAWQPAHGHTRPRELPEALVAGARARGRRPRARAPRGDRRGRPARRRACPRRSTGLDFCLRVFAAGLDCLYEPAAAAVSSARPRRGPTPQGKAEFDASSGTAPTSPPSSPRS